MTLLICVALLVLVGLYVIGWLTFEFTGVMRPLVNLTLFGYAVRIGKPDAK